MVSRRRPSDPTTSLQLCRFHVLGGCALLTGNTSPSPRVWGFGGFDDEDYAGRHLSIFPYTPAPITHKAVRNKEYGKRLVSGGRVVSHLQIGLILTIALDIGALYVTAFGWLYRSHKNSAKATASRRSVHG
jgi:hypothetical protein